MQSPVLLSHVMSEAISMQSLVLLSHVMSEAISMQSPVLLSHVAEAVLCYASAVNAPLRRPRTARIAAVHEWLRHTPVGTVPARGDSSRPWCHQR